MICIIAGVIGAGNRLFKVDEGESREISADSVNDRVRIFMGDISPSNTLLGEDWESGTIDPQKWINFGSPLATITSTHAKDLYSMTSNGDSNWDSGVASQEAFNIVPGFSAEVSVYMDSVGTSRSWGRFSVDTTPPANFDTNYGPSASCIIGFYLATNDPVATNGKLSAAPGYVTTENVTSFRNKWTNLKFVVNSDGSVTYLINGETVYVAPAGHIDIGNPPVGRIVLFGRSEGSTVTTHDELVVSQRNNLK